MNHDCCKESNIKNRQKGGVDMFIIWIIVATVLILGLAVYFSAKTEDTPQVAESPEVSMSVDTNIHDWGTIDYDAGIVSKTFSIKNTGNTNLQLYNVKTSCMCTTAQLRTSETTSRKFGMHARATDVIEVKPGETADLLVEFDPAFHGPSGVGAITRTITINTNSIENSVLNFNLTGNVIKQ